MVCYAGNDIVLYCTNRVDCYDFRFVLCLSQWRNHGGEGGGVDQNVQSPSPPLGLFFFLVTVLFFRLSCVNRNRHDDNLLYIFRRQITLPKFGSRVYSVVFTRFSHFEFSLLFYAI